VALTSDNYYSNPGDWASNTSYIPTRTPSGTISTTGGNSNAYTVTSAGVAGTTQYYGTWTTAQGPSMYRWGNQVFLNPSPKMRTLLTALQLL
jgi:hypothetical protein